VEEIQVRIKRQIDKSWSERLGGLAVAHTGNGETILTGRVRDQSALYGLLNRLSSLGLQLVSLTSSETNSPREQGGSKKCERHS